MSTTSRRLPGTLTISFCLLLCMASACTRPVAVETTGDGQPSRQSAPLTATFLGQDGGGYAGRLCSSGTSFDNVHIRLAGLRTESEPISFRVEDQAGGGVWATPCDPVSNWFLSVTPVVDNETDLYFKPFRDAPGGTEYTITVVYQDGETQIILVRGSRVAP